MTGSEVEAGKWASFRSVSASSDLNSCTQSPDDGQAHAGHLHSTDDAHFRPVNSSRLGPGTVFCCVPRVWSHVLLRSFLFSGDYIWQVNSEIHPEAHSYRLGVVLPLGTGGPRLYLGEWQLSVSATLPTFLSPLSCSLLLFPPLPFFYIPLGVVIVPYSIFTVPPLTSMTPPMWR